MEELLQSLTVELKRGTQVLAVLSQLKDAQYGYSLVQKLEEKDTAIEAGTIYPLLRRLEKQELLVSEWDTSQSRPRKFYRLSDNGIKAYEMLRTEWMDLSNKLNKLLLEEE